MRYTIRFYRQYTETINGTRLADTVDYELNNIHGEALVMVLKEIQDKGYTVRSLVIPGLSGPYQSE